jgi:ribosomal-protein-alanine N-acetyltransferase
MGRRTMCLKTNTSCTPALQTERLSLRPLTRADENALHRISNDPLVRQYLWNDEQVYAEAIRDLVQRSLHTFSDECVGLFGIRLRDSENLVGFCGFVRLEGMDELELAYELVPELWGRGLATEAARACVRYAFEEAGLGRVIAGADPPNGASVRVLEKLGMKPVGNINPLAPEEPYYALYEKGR